MSTILSPYEAVRLVNSGDVLAVRCCGNRPNSSVIAVGKITDPDIAENALLKGKCDLAAVGRSILADPDWPNKVGKSQLINT
ncbi:MAG: oxidoreductase [Desulfitobacteriaceae bacterium]